jgi:hypothetical protein
MERVILKEPIQLHFYYNWKLLIRITLGQRESNNVNPKISLLDHPFPLSEAIVSKRDFIKLPKTDYSI